MKIYNKQDFLNLPNGIVYSRYESLGMIGGLEVKTDTWKQDWVYEDLISSVDADPNLEYIDAMIKAEKENFFRLDLSCGQRDGKFDESELFAVYDKNDVERLIMKLSILLGDYKIK
jgi:hypothetical protein